MTHTARIRPSRVASAESSPGRLSGPDHTLTLMVAALLGVVPLGGLLLANAYLETAAIEAMFRGYDVVTLAIAFPLLVMSLLPPFESSLKARLLRAGVLGFTVYHYSYYVFGLAFNALFLGHVALIVLAAAALAFTFRSFYPGAVDWSCGRMRTPAILLGLLGISLAGMWISRSVVFALSGELPADGTLLIGTPALTHLGYAMDLTLIVPVYLAGAVGLWRSRPWGVMVSATALVSGTISQLTYAIALVFQYWAGIPGATAFDPYEPFIIAAYLIGSALLFRAIEGRDVRPSAGLMPRASSRDDRVGPT